MQALSVQKLVRIKTCPAPCKRGLSRDSIIIPLMIEEIGPGFSLFHHESLLSKVFRRDTRDSSS